MSSPRLLNHFFRIARRYSKYQLILIQWFLRRSRTGDLSVFARRQPFSRVFGSPGFRKRTSTALHALASETPTAKSKAYSHTEFGEAGP